MKEVTFTKGEVWTIYGGFVLIILMFIPIAIYNQNVKDQRDEYKANAKKYEVLKPIIESDVDKETIKKVLNALEKSK